MGGAGIRSLRGRRAGALLRNGGARHPQRPRVGGHVPRRARRLPGPPAALPRQLPLSGAQHRPLRALQGPRRRHHAGECAHLRAQHVRGEPGLPDILCHGHRLREEVRSHDKWRRAAGGRDLLEPPGGCGCRGAPHDVRVEVCIAGAGAEGRREVHHRGALGDGLRRHPAGGRPPGRAAEGQRHPLHHNRQRRAVGGHGQRGHGHGALPAEVRARRGAPPAGAPQAGPRLAQAPADEVQGRAAVCAGRELRSLAVWEGDRDEVPRRHRHRPGLALPALPRHRAHGLDGPRAALPEQRWRACERGRQPLRHPRAAGARGR
mmetsp:Transcript_11293/g.30766  ORF Transcript_11293/g.30766 Transcript_11293/m.30766 type:complete len:319 (+) Transcript_11293:1281-2237(+)